MVALKERKKLKLFPKIRKALFTPHWIRLARSIIFFCRFPVDQGMSQREEGLSHLRLICHREDLERSGVNTIKLFFVVIDNTKIEASVRIAYFYNSSAANLTMKVDVFDECMGRRRREVSNALVNLKLN